MRPARSAAVMNTWQTYAEREAGKEYLVRKSGRGCAGGDLAYASEPFCTTHCNDTTRTPHGDSG